MAANPGYAQLKYLRQHSISMSVTTLPLATCGRLTMGQSTSISLFKTIPPERLGLNGEYDHNGLAKRVILALRENFELNDIYELRIKQRGAVVVVTGKISSQLLLIKLVNVAMSVTGATDVEFNGVSIAQRLKTYLEVKPSRDALSNLLTLVNSD